MATLSLHASAGAQPATTVDRTFVCTPNAFAGVRQVDLWTRASLKPPPSSGFVFTPGFLIVASGALSQRLVFVYTHSEPFFERERAGVYAHPGRCREATTRIPLSSEGLPGPPTRWGTDATCIVPGRLLVRVRATLRSAGAWRRTGEYVGTTRNVVAATIAVRHQRTGRPIALLTVNRAGKVALWSSGGCD